MNPNTHGFNFHKTNMAEKLRGNKARGRIPWEFCEHVGGTDRVTAPPPGAPEPPSSPGGEGSRVTATPCRVREGRAPC